MSSKRLCYCFSKRIKTFSLAVYINSFYAFQDFFGFILFNIPRDQTFPFFFFDGGVKISIIMTCVYRYFCVKLSLKYFLSSAVIHMAGIFLS